jgi:hypothetical protein
VNDIASGEKKVILFTCNNTFGVSSRQMEIAEPIETHYQTFIVDTANKILIMIDPSRKHGGSGIYDPFAAWYVGTYISSRIECFSFWLNLQNPCQIYNNDVFCQTWSLYLLIEAMKANVLSDPNVVIKNMKF